MEGRRKGKEEGRKRERKERKKQRKRPRDEKGIQGGQGQILLKSKDFVIKKT
jgi:hypothetical protein